MQVWLQRIWFYTTITFLLLLLPCPAIPSDIHQSIEPKGDFQSVTIPLKRAGRLLLIEARIGDQTGNLIFDTGASKLVLNQTYFRNNLTLIEEAGSGITGKVEKVYQTRVGRIDLQDLYYEDVPADVINLGHLENKRGVKILGLMGMCMFRNVEIVIDLKNSELQLHRLDSSGNRIKATSVMIGSWFTFPIREIGGVVMLEATMGGKDLDFCLDTGAETNVLSNTSSRKIMNTVAITRRSDLSGSGSDVHEVLFGTMNNFFLGTRPFHPMQTMITDLEALSQAYHYPLGGVLGYDFFEKGLVSINLVKKQLGVLCIDVEQ
jgi:hypothetical protein